MNTSLSDKITYRRARVAVVGMGYVGLPLALAFAKAGFVTIGIEINSQRAEQLNAGHSYIEDVADAELRRGIRPDHLRAEMVATLDGEDIHPFLAQGELFQPQPRKRRTRCDAHPEGAPREAIDPDPFGEARRPPRIPAAAAPAAEATVPSDELNGMCMSIEAACPTPARSRYGTLRTAREPCPWTSPAPRPTWPWAAATST